MSQTGVGGGLDAVTEIQSLSSSETTVPLANESQDAFSNKTEQIETPEDAEKVIGEEAGKAASVIDFTQEAVDSASNAMDDPKSIEDENKQLQSLKSELVVIMDEREDLGIKTELKAGWTERYPNGNIVEVSISSDEVFPSEDSLENAIKSSNLTTGRRGDLSTSLDQGVEIFGTQISENLSEVPSVFCGKIGDNVLESESFRRNYGDIYNPSSEGYILLLDVPKNDAGYVDNGVEVQVTRNVKPEEIKGIVVGNETMYEQAVNMVKEKNLDIPVLKTTKTSINIENDTESKQ